MGNGAREQAMVLLFEIQNLTQISPIFYTLCPLGSLEIKVVTRSFPKCHGLPLAASLPCVPSPPHTVAAGSRSPVSGLPRWPPGLTYGGRHSPHPNEGRQTKNLTEKSPNCHSSSLQLVDSAVCSWKTFYSLLSWPEAMV